MAASTFQINSAFQFPRLRTIFKTPMNSSEVAFWDVKFYPYAVSSEETSIFALIGTQTVFICRASPDDEQGLSFLTAYSKPLDAEKTPFDEINSCTWCFVDENEPMIAYAGANGQIKVRNTVTSDLYTTLVGHGVGTINDLASHPIYPWIIASASMDGSVRIWDLKRDEHHQTKCIIICGHGQAHREGLLTVAWHDSGRYMVTGGHDHKICVWTLPDLGPDSAFWQEISPEKRKRSSEEIRVIHYPHFISSAIHSDYVDKAIFFEDLIISKASGKEDRIVIWSITGFNSHHPPPPPDTAPKTSEFLETRNGFMLRPRKSPTDNSYGNVRSRYKNLPPYERHLELNAPHASSFYMRFGFLQPSPAYPHLHPMLTAGNTASQIRFWDIQRLIMGHDGGSSNSRNDESSLMRKTPMLKKGMARKITNKDSFTSKNTQSPAGAPERGSPTSSRRSSSVATPSEAYGREVSTEATSLTSDIPRPSVETSAVDRQKYQLSDPFKRHQAHKTIDLPDFKAEARYFTARAADWSKCGRWCVVVGEANFQGVFAVLERPL